MGLFQLIMSVYSLAVTFSSAGIKLATTRITVEINTRKNHDIEKSLALCITYAGFTGSLIGLFLLVFSDFISLTWLDNPESSFPLKILSVSLPFVSMSSALGGYFTAIEKIPQFSIVQLLEQIAKILITIWGINNSTNSVAAIVAGMTAAEIFSYSLSTILKRKTIEPKTGKHSIFLSKFLRIALPDGAGSCARSFLLTVEHIMIPKGFQKSGEDSKSALAAYGNIHAMALPVILYPGAIITSFAALLIPDIAKKNELGYKDEIDNSASKTLKITFIYSLVCAAICYIFAPTISNLVYKSDEATKYIKLLSPLLPIMYLDTVTDGLLKGLDLQIYSMRYNIIDSFLCVLMVYFILPHYSVKGYIFILYASEIINFFLSFGKLISVCNIRVFQGLSGDNSMFFPLKKYSVFRKEYEYRKYPVRKKHSQAP